MTYPTERCWLCDTVAVTLTCVDFLDPALAGTPDARERGVRLELRLVQPQSGGSVYASPGLVLSPALCRIDLLESAPGARDRMHWHPVMEAGEPGGRTFDPAMVADPIAWLSDQLHEADLLLERVGVPDDTRRQAASTAVAAITDEILDAARSGLAWAREPWPDVTRDERGMALAAR